MMDVYIFIPLDLGRRARAKYRVSCGFIHLFIYFILSGLEFSKCIDLNLL